MLIASTSKRSPLNPTVAIDQYAEKALRNRDPFSTSPTASASSDQFTQHFNAALGDWFTASRPFARGLHFLFVGRSTRSMTFVTGGDRLKKKQSGLLA